MNHMFFLNPCVFFPNWLFELYLASSVKTHLCRESPNLFSVGDWNRWNVGGFQVESSCWVRIGEPLFSDFCLPFFGDLRWLHHKCQNQMILRSTIYPGWEHLATRPQAHGRPQWDWPITSEVGVLRTCNLLDQIGNVFLFQFDPIFNVDFMYWWKSWHFVWFPVIHWIYLLELDFYKFCSLQKSKESQATHALSKPKRSVSILFGITTKVFKSPMSGAGSNVLLDASTWPFNNSTCIQLHILQFLCTDIFSLYFTRPTGFLRGNESLVDGWDQQLSDCSDKIFRRLTPSNSHRCVKPYSPWYVLATEAF